LIEGWNQSKIAKHIPCSETLVRKYAKRFEREGKIERTNRSPAFWRIKTQLEPHTSLGSLAHLKPNLLPHRFGASFILIGTPHTRRDSRGITTIKEREYTVRLGRGKASIWLKSFTGTTVQEIINNSKGAILNLAQEIGNKYAVTLTFSRWYDGVEWILNDKPASKIAENKMDIRKKPKIIAETLMKIDLSDPDNMEINPAPGFSKNKPTEVAKIFDYLLTKAPLTIAEMDKRTELIEKGLEGFAEYNKYIKLHLEVEQRALDVQNETLKTLKAIQKNVQGEKIISNEDKK